MKSVLFLTPQVIVPPKDGGKRCMFDRIKSLSKWASSISLIMANSDEQKKDEALVRDYIPDLREAIVLPRINASIKKSNYLLKIGEAIKWLISGKPRAAQTIASRENKKRLTQYILDQRYEVIILEFPFCAELVELDEIKKAGVKVALVMHNVESLFFKECSNLPGWIKRIESSRLKNYEIDVLKRVDHILSISPWDAMYMQNEWGIDAVKYLPVYLEKKEQIWNFNPQSRYIVFNGSLSFYPNFHGIQWFLQNVFVQYVEEHPAVHLKITGKIDEKIKCAFGKYKNVEYTGFLSEDEMAALLCGSMFSVVPILKGSGIKIKLLEALSFGIPAITTLHGAQAIPYTGERPYLRAEDEKQFLSHMRFLSDGINERIAIGAAAKKFYDETYADASNIEAWAKEIMY